jgi:hypothetical protein
VLRTCHESEHSARGGNNDDQEKTTRRSRRRRGVHGSRSNRFRQPIYANKIEADEVRGAVHQTRGVKVRDSRGKIKAPEVVASVIYADEISANTVEADTIYVRELDRH